ncbi:hypothetical protein [Streptosporangium lutulentum]|uniref:Uncharacterized protein n=1 Tax=Streptosporangium lutulentum TaxID=1461250 RepID=A0ABT9QMZ8_9ACTN|nr:hypothetical protein [Streptosporangium lutulentum]MDP9848145.1 hypothetical protein [Streptosporangium lutulentum]
MFPRSSSLTALPWPVLLIGAWLATIAVIALLVYAIAKAAINKTDARDLPTVLPVLAQLLGGLARPLNRALTMPASVVSPAMVQEASPQEQTGSQGIDAIGTGQ